MGWGFLVLQITMFLGVFMAVLCFFFYIARLCCVEKPARHT